MTLTSSSRRTLSLGMSRFKRSLWHSATSNTVMTNFRVASKINYLSSCARHIVRNGPRTIFFFDVADFERVVAAHPPIRNSQLSSTEIGSSNFIAFQSWGRCYSAVVRLASKQRSESSNNIRNDDFRTDRINLLQRHVCIRNHHVRRARCEEKKKDGPIPYLMLEHLKPLELQFTIPCI
jgi:hypothetical protein